jgi:hypothetical protein
MSDHDPYAPVVEEATVTNAPVEAAPVAAEPEVEYDPATAVPDGSAKDVLAWVGDDRAKAQAALAFEVDNQKRTTLIAKLNNIID